MRRRGVGQALAPVCPEGGLCFLTLRLREYMGSLASPHRAFSCGRIWAQQLCLHVTVTWSCDLGVHPFLRSLTTRAGLLGPPPGLGPAHTLPNDRDMERTGRVPGGG